MPSILTLEIMSHLFLEFLKLFFIHISTKILWVHLHPIERSGEQGMQGIDRGAAAEL
jgi:hypothetical protein